MNPQHGRFPFGRPSTERPPRRPDGEAAVFVLGVYPSALHVRWTGPEGTGSSPARVGALAVDNEPTCFWSGRDADDRIRAWRDAVGFPDDGSWGTVGAAATNGSSGQIVAQQVLRPLQVGADAAWLTDALPWFFVKYANSKSRREQGDAIAQSYGPFAAHAGLTSADLPSRPSAQALVDIAVNTQRERLRSELLESRTRMVVTLGQESWDTLCRVVDNVRTPSAKLSHTHYGTAGSVTIGLKRFEWLPLAHPGIIRRAGPWKDAHIAWSAAYT